MDVSSVSFNNDISDLIIDQLVDEGRVLHCAGGIMIEHPLLQPCIVSTDGTQESFMGLPTHLLVTLLEAIDIEV